MPDFEAFCGPSYQLTNKYAAIERTVNFYNSVNEYPDQETKFKFDLEPCPGNAPFCELPVPAPFNQPNRGLLENRGKVYGVNGTVVFSIDSTGKFTNIGKVVSDGTPCSMVANGNGQIFIASAGIGYVIPANNGPNTLQVAGVAASYATFQDGYILVVRPNSNIFQISGTDDVPLGDATKWDAANISVQAGQADYLQAIISSREYVRLLGSRRSQIYFNSGAPLFPFQSYNETFIETGIAAPFSLADLGDSLIWVGNDARGQRACWRDSAFQPQRVSNFAVERFWQGYASVADAVAFPYIWMGHLFYQITFPSASINAQNVKTSATWVYDVTASQLAGRHLWHERTYQTAMGYTEGRSELFHCYGYGKHLVGSSGVDGNPGAIYQYSATQYTDCGTSITGSQSQQQIVRDRICPHIWEGNKRIIFNRIEFEMARGVGLDGNQNPGTNPQLLLKWSNDGGNTWTAEHNVPVGMIGQFAQRVYFNRAGYGRDRVWWVRCTDPVYWAFVNAIVDLVPLGS